MERQQLQFFNLKEDKATAIVRLLHTGVHTIESQATHSIQVGNKTRKIKCLNEGCPLCAKEIRKDNRIYIHLYDYADNCEKVWDRTDKILPQLVELEGAWGRLCDSVVKITREGNDFPKYTVTAVNPASYTVVPPQLVDVPLARFYSLGRSKADIETFLATGAFPEKKAFIPKEEYLRQQKEKNEAQAQPQYAPQPAPQPYAPQQQPVQQPQYTPQAQPTFENVQQHNFGNVSQVPTQQAPTFDPFMDQNITKPKRI